MDIERLSTVIRNANPILQEPNHSVDDAWIDLVAIQRGASHRAPSRMGGVPLGWTKRRRLLSIAAVALLIVGASTVLGIRGSSNKPSLTNSLARAFGVVNANAATSGGFTATPSSPQGFNVMTCPTSQVCYIESTNSTTSESASTSVTLVFKSVDGGASWKPLSLPAAGSPDTPFSCSSESVCSVGVQSGPVYSQTPLHKGTVQSILTTTDGGSTWTSHVVAINPILGGDPSLDASLQGVQGSWDQLQCFSATSCVAVALAPSDQPEQPFAGVPGSPGVLRTVVMSTSDGGSTWDSSVIPWSTAFDGSPGWSNAQEMTLSCATISDCVGLTTVFHSVVDNSQTARVKVWRSVDAGSTWQTNWLPASVEASGLRLSCPTVSDCYATVVVGTNVSSGTSEVMATHDGGMTWTFVTPVPASSGAPRYEYHSISCTDATNCWVSGEIMPSGHFGDGTSQASIWATSNSGSSWVSVPLAAGLGYVSQVTCSAPDSCLAIAGPPYKSGQAIPQGPLPGEILSNVGS